VYSYIFKVLKGDFVNITVDSVKAQFGKTIIGPIPPILWQAVALTVVGIIIIAGVEKGIEKVTKTLIPVLFVLIIIIALRALSLPGAGAGLKFLFKPDFSKITPAIILEAMGLAFFKLSLGMGTMTTYGSYFTDDNNMISTSVKVALSDIVVSLLAGIAIFPTVFTFGMKPEAGPGLLFMTIPLVFSKIPFGRVLLLAFFVLTAIAATTAMMSIVEVLVAYFTEEKGMKRSTATIMNIIIIFIIGILASLSADSSGALGGIKIFLGRGFFDTFDYISSNIFLPIGGLLISIFVGYIMKKQDVKDELTNHGTLGNGTIVNVYLFILTYITPLLLIIVFLNCVNIIKF
jgi:NSS family neurotransmitter:Na+ symporter